MSSPPPVLVLYARRVPGPRAALVETLAGLTGALGNDEDPLPRGLGRWFRFLDRNSYRSLSYVIDWLDAFRKAPGITARCCNIVDLANWPRLRRLVREVPLIVVMHSAAGDDLWLVSRLTGTLAARRGRLLTFFGNEYTRMPEKIAFARETGADFIASQLPMRAAQWLYAECPEARILAAPAALNPHRYFPLDLPRDLDIGFRGDLYPLSIGDQERTRILEYFRLHGRDHGLRTDIAYARETGEQWQRFLSRCHGIVGAESGTYYLERDDATEHAVNAWLAQHPDTDFAALHARFFAGHPRPVSGKAISSRHFEAIGTRTAQILLEGEYNGILEPDRHYFSVRKDLSNVAEVARRFADPSERARVADAAYGLVREAHTYAHRAADLLAAALT